MNKVYRRNIPQSRSHVRLKFVTRLVFINAYDGPAHASNFACEVPPVVSKITPGTRPLYKPWASHWDTLLLERDNIMLAPRSSSVLGFFYLRPAGPSGAFTHFDPIRFAGHVILSMCSSTTRFSSTAFWCEVGERERKM